MKVPESFERKGPDSGLRSSGSEKIPDGIRMPTGGGLIHGAGTIGTKDKCGGPGLFEKVFPHYLNLKICSSKADISDA